MPWYDLTYVQCSVLTAEKMTRLQGNLAALAGQDSGAPLVSFANSPTPALQAVGASSVQTLHVGSGIVAPGVSSFATLHAGSGVLAPQVASLGTVHAGSGVLAPQVSSFGTLHVSSGLLRPAGVPWPLPPGHLGGLVLANNTTDAQHDLDVSPGAARDAGDTTDLVLASALTKRIDASWAVGTNQGGLDGTESVAGTPDADTWYHVWLIRRSDTGVVDVLLSESATAPNLPTGYDAKRRIGAVLTDGSANLVPFAMKTLAGGRRFSWVTRRVDVDITTLGTTATHFTLSVPTGLRVLALVRASVWKSAASPWVTVDDPDVADTAPAGTGAGMGNLGSNDTSVADTKPLQVPTNTSGQVRARSDQAGTTFRVATEGWIE